jgi:hypothetical protein
VCYAAFFLSRDVLLRIVDSEIGFRLEYSKNLNLAACQDASYIHSLHGTDHVCLAKFALQWTRYVVILSLNLKPTHLVLAVYTFNKLLLNYNRSLIHNFRFDVHDI